MGGHGFPLFDKARRAGILASGNGLIVAPTATGKSYLGRTILRLAVDRHEPGVHVYLVPYRALASEVCESFKKELNGARIEARVRLATGDYSDPIRPQQTDILIATYERFAGLFRMPDLRIGRVVIDEAHLVADQTRGPVVEGLIARMKAFKQPKSLCALSAVVANPEELGQWLGVPVLVGDVTDRAVEVELCCDIADDVDARLTEELLSVLSAGEQAIIFCRSKPASQSTAKHLKPIVRGFLTHQDEEALRSVALSMAEDDEDAEEMLSLLDGGVAFHNAGLSRESRRAVETAFRERHLKVIACTPTLAAGVNLPARLVIVRDVYRTENVRGYWQRVVLSTGELLNMMGRAGRPGQVDRGRGVALVEKDLLDDDGFAHLQVAIHDGRGNPVASHLPDSFDSLMRFLLAAAADRGETTLDDLADTVRQTLWYREEPAEIGFARPFEVDIMEDIPSFKRVTSDMRVERVWSVADGVAGSVISGPNVYNFSIRFSGMDCTCPARAKWHRNDVCKHLACAINHLLFGPGIDAETRTRTMYAAAHRFRKSLDLGTKIREAVNILCAWNLLEQVPGAYQATPVGVLAASSSLDLLLIRTAHDRIREFEGIPTPRDVALWVIEDYFADDKKRENWLRAAMLWLDEIDVKRIKLPEKYRGDFERGLENLGQLATAYGEIGASLGKPQFLEICRLARGCLQYGVSPDLIPLAALRIPQLGRARCRYIYEKGTHSLEDLARANPEDLRGPHAPIRLTEQWVATAKEMWQARGHVLAVPIEERYQAIDSLLADFQVDQLSLFGKNGVFEDDDAAYTDSGKSGQRIGS